MLQSVCTEHSPPEGLIVLRLTEWDALLFFSWDNTLLCKKSKKITATIVTS